MTPDRTAAGALSPELETIAAAAHDRLHAQAGADLSAVDQAARRVADAASAAGARLGAIADAEREGELRARQELSGDVLRQVTRAAKRKREADSEYEHAISRAGRLGLSHREIAAVAQVSHGTVRAILTRASTITRQRAARRAAASRQRSGRARRITANHHRPATGAPARDLALGAPSAPRSSCTSRS